MMEPLVFLAQVEKENFVIQELKNHLHQVLRLSENNLLRTKQEAEKQQKADFRASQARAAKIQQEILRLRSQHHNLVVENREAEQALRKVRGDSREGTTEAPGGGGGRGGGCSGRAGQGGAPPARQGTAPLRRRAWEQGKCRNEPVSTPHPLCYTWAWGLGRRHWSYPPARWLCDLGRVP